MRRSPDSLSFQEIMLAPLSDGSSPSSAIDPARFGDFAPWIAIAEPMAGHRRIEIKVAGSGFAGVFGRDLVNSDYLDLAQPEIRELAYQSALAMLDQPCGLWQQTPFFVPKVGAGLAEYTVFPIVDARSRARQLVAYIRHPQAAAWEESETVQIMGAMQWGWIDIGHGVPWDA